MSSSSPAPVANNSGLAVHIPLFADERPTDWTNDEKAKGFLWMVLIFQANRNILALDTVISKLNSPAWKSKFGTVPIGNVPDAVKWCDSRAAYGEENLWNFIRVPVPLSELNSEDRVRTAFAKAPDGPRGDILGIIGLQKDSDNLYWELCPLERFLVEFDPANPQTPNKSAILQSLVNTGTIQTVRTPNENLTNDGNTVAVFSTVTLMRMWAKQHDGNFSYQRHFYWGMISDQTGLVSRPGVKAIYDAGQEENNAEKSRVIGVARDKLSIGSGKMAEGTVVVATSTKTPWWIYIVVILAVIGLLTALGFIFMNRRSGGGGDNVVYGD